MVSFEKVKSPVLATVSKSERQEQMDNTIIKTREWEDAFRFIFVKKEKLIWMVMILKLEFRVWLSI
jgi:hypothetical protein